LRSSMAPRLYGMHCMPRLHQSYQGLLALHLDLI